LRFPNRSERIGRFNLVLDNVTKSELADLARKACLFASPISKRAKIHVFLNSRRHRGMKVCRYEQGNTSLFTCPYHSWSYTTDGKPQGVLLYKSLYDGVLDRQANSLVSVAKLCDYTGSIWATWDKDAPDFLTYLRDAKIHLDQALDCRDGPEGGSEAIGLHKWVFPANWKFAAETFLGDTYHNPSHRCVPG
jgi:phenylpropionate dioxygenase-like ring-hydroxylating dioxygenase large terminal subunit